MNTKNQLSNQTLDVFRRNGFVVYEKPEENLVSIVKYFHEEPKAPLLIQFDYQAQRLLIIEQNIFQHDTQPQPIYNAPIPPDTEDFIKLLSYTRIVNQTLLGALLRNL